MKRTKILPSDPLRLPLTPRPKVGWHHVQCGTRHATIWRTQGAKWTIYLYDQPGAHPLADDVRFADYWIHSVKGRSVNFIWAMGIARAWIQEQEASQPEVTYLPLR